MNPKYKQDRVARARLERDEQWQEIKIPALRFPAGWIVEPVAPFAGALARFLITNAHGVKVSVYFDAHGALGAVDNPYWEVYPVKGQLTVADDPEPDRFFGDDTTDMIEHIANLGDPVRGAIAGLTGEGVI